MSDVVVPPGGGSPDELVPAPGAAPTPPRRRPGAASAPGSRPPTTSASACSTSARRWSSSWSPSTFAMLMRTQLIRPDSTSSRPQEYNQIFTMHGTTMVFLFAMPILIGLANYLVPLMIGARDMAFPRLNALSYWLFLFGGLLLYSSFVFGGALDTGWFSYAPLTIEGRTRRTTASTSGRSLWRCSAARRSSARSTSSSPCLRFRAPGMRLRQMPIFVDGDLHQLVPDPVRLPEPDAPAIALLYLDRQLRHHASSTRPAAATRSSGSTSSGSSATRRSTSSSCRPSAS